MADRFISSPKNNQLSKIIYDLCCIQDEVDDIIDSASPLTVAVTTITGGANGSVLINNDGVLGEADVCDLIEGCDIVTLYTANGTLEENRIVDQDDHTLTFTNVGSFGIGGSANTVAILDVQTTTKGVKFPAMTTAQRTAIVTANIPGLQVYDTDIDGMFYTNNSGNWIQM